MQTTDDGAKQRKCERQDYVLIPGARPRPGQERMSTASCSVLAWDRPSAAVVGAQGGHQSPEL